MVVSRQSAHGKKNRLSSQEAYSIWEALASRYQEIEQLTLWENFTHDADLRLHVNSARSQALKDAASWEKVAKSMSIKGPDAARKGMNTSMNSEVFHDEQIGMWLLEMLQEDFEKLFRVVRISTTNDSIRRRASRKIRQLAGYLDDYVKYLKLKGWINQPPLYPNVPKDTSEQLSCGEAGHLWDHLTFRYDNIEDNKVYLDTAHDGDFRLILNFGVTLLSRQIKRLEKELLHFGIPLPKAPSAVHAGIEDTEVADDDTTYRWLLTGLQGAVLLHVKAFNHSTTNERIRSLFRKLLISEIGLVEKLILFGKVKGWLNPAPDYMV